MFSKLARGVHSAVRPSVRFALGAVVVALLIAGRGARLISRWYTNLGAIALLPVSRDASRAPQLAAEMLRRACELDGRNPSARRLLGQYLYWQGDYESAREVLSQNLQNSATDGLSYYWRGRVNFDDARYKEAGEDWRQAGFLAYELQTLHKEAYDLSLQGNVAAAEADLLIAVQLSPTDPSGYYALGGLYWGRPERRADAISAFQTGITLDRSDSFQRLWAEGRLRLIEKQWTLAVVALEKAVHLNPEHKEAFTQLGYAYWQNGQIEQARTTLSLILQQWPEYFEPYLYLSTIAGERGDAESSVRYMLSYLAVQPDNPRACDRLAHILSDRRTSQWVGWTLAEMARMAPASVACRSSLARLAPSPK